MSTSRFAPQLLLSPSAETEAVVLRMLKSQNLVLLHAVTWAAISLFLVLLNVLIDGLATPWSLYPLAAWGVVVAGHWVIRIVLGRRGSEEKHRRLASSWSEHARLADVSSLSEIRDLREKLLAGAEAAREALRPISPEATADVSRGEASALELVAWLDQAEPLLARSSAARDSRQEVAAALSKPMSEADRAPLERLLTQLDLQDVKLAVLERETSRRRSVLESFLLVLESTGVAGSSTDVLTAVSDPLRGRVKLLEEVARSAVEGAKVGEGSAPASDRIREEVRLAQELQSSILPSKAPEIPGLAVAHFYRPSSEVGGDFFDFYALGPGRLLVAVGDASGHGLDSSMVSSMMKSALYTHVSAGRSLEESMVEMNRMMCDTVGRRRLMTLALLEIDVAAHRLTWVNAGHVFPLLVSGSDVRELEQSSYPLGVRREVDYSVLEETLQPGDRIVLVTDGCIEALDADGEVYGWDRLGERLREIGGADSQAIVDGLAEDFWSHLSGQPAQDDITMVVVAFEP
jgi:serine phosphatase RsbU (regulator of sigma subunit)